MAVLIENPPDLVQEQVLDPTAQNAAAEQEIAQRCLV